MKKVVLGVFEVRTISVLSPDWKLVSQAEGKNRRAFSAWYIFWPPIHNRTIVNICSRRRNDPAMLYLIGLGLADETDVTVKGLELIKKVGRVYIEAYTSILLVDTEKLVRSMLVS